MAVEVAVIPVPEVSDSAAILNSLASPCAAVAGVDEAAETETVDADADAVEDATAATDPTTLAVDPAGLRPRLGSLMMHSRPSRRQLVHGCPPIMTSHRTLRLRQDRQALDERRFITRSFMQSNAGRFSACDRTDCPMIPELSLLGVVVVMEAKGRCVIVEGVNTEYAQFLLQEEQDQFG